MTVHVDKELPDMRVLDTIVRVYRYMTMECLT